MDCRTEFLERYKKPLTGKASYGFDKRLLLVAHWAKVRRLVETGQADPEPKYLEVHPSEPCQLSCLYCRGSLRDAPKVGKLLQVGVLPDADFVRFSGTIGEPLLNASAVDEMDRLGSMGRKFGITTNGLALSGRASDILMLATYVHVSIDAASPATYLNLKGGRPGFFDRAVENVTAFAKRMGRPELVMSFLIQKENANEILMAVGVASAVGVDVLEFKMQHFDPRRTMEPGAVRAVYAALDSLPSMVGNMRVVVTQDEIAALGKLHPDALVDFDSCYAGRLGFTATLDPKGAAQSCCQYFQNTLGAQSQLGAFVDGDPRTMCDGCSPSDEFINRFVSLMVRGYAGGGPKYLDWVQEALGA